MHSFFVFFFFLVCTVLNFNFIAWLCVYFHPLSLDPGHTFVNISSFRRRVVMSAMPLVLTKIRVRRSCPLKQAVKLTQSRRARLALRSTRAKVISLYLYIFVRRI